MPRKTNLFIKCIASMLMAAFFISDVAHAYPSDSVAVFSNGRAPGGPRFFEAPSEFALLKEIHQGPGDVFIIHIQDAHANVSGQENLAGALMDILAKYDVRLVLSEGGTEDCSLTPLKKIASQDVWKKVAKSYLMKGKLKGEEYVNLVSDRPMSIIGIEDMDLYMKSVANYGRLAEKRQERLDYLKRVQASLEKLKVKLYPEALLAYEKTADEISFAAFFALARQGAVDLAGFENLSQFEAVQKKEKTVNFEAANLEHAVLIEEIARRGGRADLEEHLKKADSLKGHKLSQFTYFQNTLNIAKQKGVETANYTHLMAYGDYLDDFSRLDLDAVLDEKAVAEEKIVRQLLTGNEDAGLVRAIDRYLRLLETAYRIQMTTAEFGLFQANEPDFATVDYLAFVNRRLAEFGYFDDLLPYLNVFEQGKLALNEFYDSVARRDLAFLENTAGALKDRKQKVAVLISGGYHTPHLKKLFKEKGYSYAVLAPLVTSDTNQQKYERLLLSPLKSRQAKAQAAEERDTVSQMLRATRVDDENANQALRNDLEEIAIAAARLSNKDDKEARDLVKRLMLRPKKALQETIESIPTAAWPATKAPVGLRSSEDGARLAAKSYDWDAFKLRLRDEASNPDRVQIEKLDGSHTELLQFYSLEEPDREPGVIIGFNGDGFRQTVSRAEVKRILEVPAAPGARLTTSAQTLKPVLRRGYNRQGGYYLYRPGYRGEAYRFYLADDAHVQSPKDWEPNDFTRRFRDWLHRVGLAGKVAAGFTSTKFFVSSKASSAVMELHETSNRDVASKISHSVNAAYSQEKDRQTLALFKPIAEAPAPPPVPKIAPASVPVRNVPYSDKPVHWAAAFGNGHPLTVDIGSGDGEFLLDQAKRHPAKNFIGIDFFKRPLRAPAELRNIRTVTHDVRTAVPHMFVDGQVSEFYLIFPMDHELKPKDRVFDERHHLPEALLKKLLPGGRMLVVSESASLMLYIERRMSAAGFQLSKGGEINPQLESDNRLFLEETGLSLGHSTYFQKFGGEDGHYKVRYLEFTAPGARLSEAYVKKVGSRWADGTQREITLDGGGVVEAIASEAQKQRLGIQFAGGTARRMLLGKNPIDANADLDLVVDRPPRWFAGDFYQRLDRFKDWIYDTHGFEADIMNYEDSHDKIILWPPYQRVEANRSTTLDRMLVRMKGRRWVVEDQWGKRFLQDAQAPYLRLVPREETSLPFDYFPVMPKLDYDSALRFVRVWAEFPDIGVGTVSLEELSRFVTAGESKERGGVDFEQMGSEGFDAELAGLFQAEESKLGRGVSPIKNLLKVFIHARDPRAVPGLLQRIGDERRSLRTVFGQWVDLDRAAEIVEQKRRSGEKIRYSDFDPVFPQSFVSHPLAKRHSAESLKAYLTSKLTLSPNNEARSNEFVDQELSGWLSNLSEGSLGETALANSVLPEIWKEDILGSELWKNIERLKPVVSKRLFQHLMENRLSIDLAMLNGQYENLLDYYFRSYLHAPDLKKGAPLAKERGEPALGEKNGARLAEIVDQIDDHNQVIGQIDRDQAHKTGVLHRGVTILLRDARDGSIVFQRRAPNKSTFPGRFDVIAAGHPTAGSGVLGAAIKETKEEAFLIDAARFIRVGAEAYFKADVEDPAIGHNRELKTVYFVDLTPEEADFLKNKNPELKAFWALDAAGRKAAVDAKAKELKVSPEEAESYFEVGEYIFMPLKDAVALYRQKPEDFADGFYSLFGRGPNVEEYTRLITETMDNSPYYLMKQIDVTEKAWSTERQLAANLSAKLTIHTIIALIYGLVTAKTIKWLLLWEAPQDWRRYAYPAVLGLADVYVGFLVVRSRYSLKRQLRASEDRVAGHEKVLSGIYGKIMAKDFKINSRDEYTNRVLTAVYAMKNATQASGLKLDKLDAGDLEDITEWMREFDEAVAAMLRMNALRAKILNTIREAIRTLHNDATLFVFKGGRDEDIATSVSFDQIRTLRSLTRAFIEGDESIPVHGDFKSSGARFAEQLTRSAENFVLADDQPVFPGRILVEGDSEFIKQQISRLTESGKYNLIHDASSKSSPVPQDIEALRAYWWKRLFPENEADKARTQRYKLVAGEAGEMTVKRADGRKHKTGARLATKRGEPALGEKAAARLTGETLNQLVEDLADSESYDEAFALLIPHLVVDGKPYLDFSDATHDNVGSERRRLAFYAALELFKILQSKPPLSAERARIVEVALRSAERQGEAHVKAVQIIAAAHWQEWHRDIEYFEEAEKEVITPMGYAEEHRRLYGAAFAYKARYNWSIIGVLGDDPDTLSETQRKKKRLSLETDLAVNENSFADIETDQPLSGPLNKVTVVIRMPSYVWPGSTSAYSAPNFLWANLPHFGDERLPFFGAEALANDPFMRRLKKVEAIGKLASADILEHLEIGPSQGNELIGTLGYTRRLGGETDFPKQYARFVGGLERLRPLVEAKRAVDNAFHERLWSASLPVSRLAGVADVMEFIRDVDIAALLEKAVRGDVEARRAVESRGYRLGAEGVSALAEELGFDSQALSVQKHYDSAPRPVLYEVDLIHVILYEIQTNWAHAGRQANTLLVARRVTLGGNDGIEIIGIDDGDGIESVRQGVESGYTRTGESWRGKGLKTVEDAATTSGQGFVEFGTARERWIYTPGALEPAALAPAISRGSLVRAVRFLQPVATGTDIRPRASRLAESKTQADALKYLGGLSGLIAEISQRNPGALHEWNALILPLKFDVVMSGSGEVKELYDFISDLSLLKRKLADYAGKLPKDNGALRQKVEDARGRLSAYEIQIFLENFKVSPAELSWKARRALDDYGPVWRSRQLRALETSMMERYGKDVSGLLLRDVRATLNALADHDLEIKEFTASGLLQGAQAFNAMQLALVLRLIGQMARKLRQIDPLHFMLYDALPAARYLSRQEFYQALLLASRAVEAGLKPDALLHELATAKRVLSAAHFNQTLALAGELIDRKIDPAPTVFALHELSALAQKTRKKAAEADADALRTTRSAGEQAAGSEALRLEGLALLKRLAAKDAANAALWLQQAKAFEPEKEPASGPAGHRPATSVLPLASNELERVKAEMLQKRGWANEALKSVDKNKQSAAKTLESAGKYEAFFPHAFVVARRLAAQGQDPAYALRHALPVVMQESKEEDIEANSRLLEILTEKMHRAFVIHLREGLVVESHDNRALSLDEGGGVESLIKTVIRQAKKYPDFAVLLEINSAGSRAKLIVGDAHFMHTFSEEAAGPIIRVNEDLTTLGALFSYLKTVDKEEALDLIDASGNLKPTHRLYLNGRAYGFPDGWEGTRLRAGEIIQIKQASRLARAWHQTKVQQTIDVNEVKRQFLALYGRGGKFTSQSTQDIRSIVDDVGRANAFLNKILNRPMNGAALFDAYGQFQQLLTGAKWRDDEVRRAFGVQSLFGSLFTENFDAEIRADAPRAAARVFVELIRYQHFSEANHRAAFLVMNYILMKSGYTPLVLTPRNIDAYVRILYNDPEGFSSKPQENETLFAQFLKGQVRPVGRASRPRAQDDARPQPPSPRQKPGASRLATQRGGSALDTKTGARGSRLAYALLLEEFGHEGIREAVEFVTGRDDLQAIDSVDVNVNSKSYARPQREIWEFVMDSEDWRQPVTFFSKSVTDPAYDYERKRRYFEKEQDVQQEVRSRTGLAVESRIIEGVDGPRLVQKRAEGKPLNQLEAEGLVNRQVILAVVEGVARLHRAGVLHNDLVIEKEGRDVLRSDHIFLAGLGWVPRVTQIIDYGLSEIDAPLQEDLDEEFLRLREALFEKYYMTLAPRGQFKSPEEFRAALEDSYSKTRGFALFEDAALPVSAVRLAEPAPKVSLTLDEPDGWVLGSEHTSLSVGSRLTELTRVKQNLDPRTTEVLAQLTADEWTLRVPSKSVPAQKLLKDRERMLGVLDNLPLIERFETKEKISQLFDIILTNTARGDDLFRLIEDLNKNHFIPNGFFAYLAVYGLTSDNTRFDGAYIDIYPITEERLHEIQYLDASGALKKEILVTYEVASHMMEGPPTRHAPPGQIGFSGQITFSKGILDKKIKSLEAIRRGESLLQKNYALFIEWFITKQPKQEVARKYYEAALRGIDFLGLEKEAWDRDGVLEMPSGEVRKLLPAFIELHEFGHWVDRFGAMTIPYTGIVTDNLDAHLLSTELSAHTGEFYSVDVDNRMIYSRLYEFYRVLALNRSPGHYWKSVKILWADLLEQTGHKPLAEELKTIEDRYDMANIEKFTRAYKILLNIPEADIYLAIERIKATQVGGPDKARIITSRLLSSRTIPMIAETAHLATQSGEPALGKKNGARLAKFEGEVTVRGAGEYEQTLRRQSVAALERVLNLTEKDLNSVHALRKLREDARNVRQIVIHVGVKRVQDQAPLERGRVEVLYDPGPGKLSLWLHSIPRLGALKPKALNLIVLDALENYEKVREWSGEQPVREERNLLLAAGLLNKKIEFRRMSVPVRFKPSTEFRLVVKPAESFFHPITYRDIDTVLYQLNAFGRHLYGDEELFDQAEELWKRVEDLHHKLLGFSRGSQMSTVPSGELDREAALLLVDLRGLLNTTVDRYQSGPGEGSRLAVVRRVDTAYSFPRGVQKGAPPKDAKAVVLELEPGAFELEYRQWPQRVSKPFTEAENRIFENERGRLSDLGTLGLQRDQIRSVRQTLHDRSSGAIVLRIIIETRNNHTYYVEFGGPDTSSLEIFKKLEARLPELKVPGAAAQVSVSNQGDLAGNLTWIAAPASPQGWEVFAATDEPWDGKRYRALVEFSGGRRALGTVRALKSGEVVDVYLTPVGQETEIKLKPEETKFVFIASAVGWGDAPVGAVLEQSYTRTSDLRHIFDLPFDSGTKQFTFYRQMASRPEILKQAFAGQALDLRAEPLDSVQMTKQGYVEKTTAAQVTEPGDYFVGTDTVRIRLLPAIYPINTLVVSADGRHAAFVNVQGLSGREGADYWRLHEWIKKDLGLTWAYAVFALDNGLDNNIIDDALTKSVLVKGREVTNASLSVMPLRVSPSRLAATLAASAAPAAFTERLREHGLKLLTPSSEAPPSEPAAPNFLQQQNARLAHTPLADVAAVKSSAKDFSLFKQLASALPNEGAPTAFRFEKGDTLLIFERVDGVVAARLARWDKESASAVVFARYPFSPEEIEEGRAARAARFDVAEAAFQTLESRPVQTAKKEHSGALQAFRAWEKLGRLRVQGADGLESPVFDGSKTTVHVLRLDQYVRGVVAEHRQAYLAALEAKVLALKAQQRFDNTHLFFVATDPLLADAVRRLNASFKAPRADKGTHFMLHADVGQTGKEDARAFAKQALEAEGFVLPEALPLGFIPFSETGEPGAVLPFTAEIVFADIVARLDLSDHRQITAISHILKPLMQFLIQDPARELATRDNLRLLQSFDARQYARYALLAIRAIEKLNIDEFLTYTQLAAKATSAAA